MHRQLHQPQGRRTAFPGEGRGNPPSGCRDGRDVLRRRGPGNHLREENHRFRTGLPSPDRHRHTPRGHHFRCQCPLHRHGHSRARPLRHRLHRSRPVDQAEPARHLYLRRYLQPLLRLPGQQPGAQRDARGLPVPRHPRRPGHGHRQSRHGPPVRRHRTGTADCGRRPDSLPHARCFGKDDRPCGICHSERSEGIFRFSRRPEASSE